MVEENKDLNSPKMTLEEEIEYKSEMKLQLISFAMMIILTIVAFAAVASDAITPAFKAIFVLIMAGIQFVFQVYVFMHMGQKNHEFPTLAIWTGFFVALLCIVGIAALIW
ncbi:cytochrome B6 [Pueribacillus theae]|uniref:Cytochrome B6 n=1 Tax=Pueribacillus theae TaxID=2171751 RepID=A0A2U1K765_9BACI|nr:cytochrome C oxidase subunit IV family protein [Pueribacillus theae]PWA13381.1 cytochrome B6 [Pueribacillus theae]